jgi:hypothetical protein
MKLLEKFDIMPFCRVVWVNGKAKEVWEGALAEVSKLVSELEVLSVSEGQRLCSWQTISESSLLEMSKKYAEMGLTTLPIKRVASFGGFAHKHMPPVEGKPTSVCIIIAKTLELCLRYQKVFEANDNIAQGELLGFPKCCSEFFQKSWKEGYFDPIWQMALNSVVVETGDNSRTIKGNWLSNPLLRYIGPRSCFHIPHSFSCSETIKIGQERMKLAERTNKEVALLLQALLKMPVSWDVRHGIAVVKTPIFYLIVQSIPSVERYRVSLLGEFIPREAEDER